MPTTSEDTPTVACDLSDAPDTGAERLAEYGRLFDAAYVSRSRAGDGVRWVLRADPGIEEWARDLADRENACCTFMTSTVTREGGHILWHAATVDDPTARAALDLFFGLPDQRWSSAEQMLERWRATGAGLVVREGDGTRPATAGEVRQGLGHP